MTKSDLTLQDGVQLKVKETTMGIDHNVSIHVRGADVGPIVKEK